MILPAALVAAALLCAGPSLGSAGQPHREEPGVGENSPFTVDGRIALAALIALSDGHLQKLADSLEQLAESEAARSADWREIEGALAKAGKRNVAALNWFALPDGSYWSVQEGKAPGNLANRPYFPSLLAGHRVIGELVVSRATGRSVAIVAVPVLEENGEVVGILGSSVYLDHLGERIRRELDLGDDVIFYSFNAAPLLGMVHDPGLIFTDPSELGEEVAGAFEEMLTREEGVVTYTFRERSRTVLYRKSPVSGWWYAFGRLGQP